MTKILLIDGKDVKLIEKRGFAQEAKLQDYLEEYPAVIPLTDIIEDASQLLTIGREISAGQGWIDVLLIDKDGLLTVVETKLARNPEARREVVGQIIEYASYVSKWTADDVYKIANGYLQSEKVQDKYRNKTLDEAIRDMAGDEASYSPEDFRPSIENHLKDGRMRLIIAVDEIIEPLRAMVTFLNSYSNFDIFLLQVSSFEESPFKRVLFPVLFGYTARTAKTAATKTTRSWNKESFFEDARKRCEPSIVNTMEKLYEFTRSNTDRDFFGKGAINGSFMFTKPIDGKPTTIFIVESNGKWYPYPAVLRDRGVSHEAIQSFIERLNAIPGIRIPQDGSTSYMRVETLEEDENFRMFKEAVLALIRKM